MPVPALPAAPAAYVPGGGRRPVVTPGQVFSVASDAAVDTPLGAVTTSGGAPTRFSIIGSTPFRIHPTNGTLRVNAALPAPGTVPVTVRAINAAGGTQAVVDVQIVSGGAPPDYTANSLSVLANSLAPVNAGS